MMLAQGYDAQGNTGAAIDNYETSSMFNDLALAGIHLSTKLGR